MPIKLRRPKRKRFLVTPEIIEAFRNREVFKLQRLVGLNPSLPAPLPLEISGLGVDRTGPPNGIKPTRDKIEAWYVAQDWLAAIRDSECREQE